MSDMDKANREVRKILRRKGFLLWDSNHPNLFHKEIEGDDWTTEAIAIVHEGEAFFYYRDSKLDDSEAMEEVVIALGDIAF